MANRFVRLGAGLTLGVVGLMGSFVASAQITMSTSGNWSDPTIWTAGTVPVNTSGTTGSPVSVGQPVTIDQNISITTGVYYFGYTGSATSSTNATDQPGGTAYTLTMNNGASNVSTQCILDVKSGTVTFEGTADLTAANLTVQGGATLIVGNLNINNKCAIKVYGTLIVNGDLTNSNSSGSFVVQTGGVVLVNGNYVTNNGNLSVSGGGDMFTTGSITNQGSSTTFGSSNDCTTGPCSGNNLCGYTNTVSADQVVCSGITPASLSGSTSASSPTIQWQMASSLTGFNTYASSSSGTDPCNGCNITGATTTSYSPPSVTTTTASQRFYRMYITDGSCISYSYPVQILTLSSGGWLGTTSEWNTGSNWCSSSVPTSTSSVYLYPFPTGSTKVMPTIGTADANVKYLTIARSSTGSTSATLNLSAGRTLNIYGTATLASTTSIAFLNNGTFSSASTGTVNFVGTSSSTVTQHIGGSSATTFGNLTVNNSGTSAAITVINNNVTVTGTQTMTAGNINLNGFTWTLGSSASTTGTLSYTNGWMYGGNIQRWYPTSSVTVGSAASLFPIGSTSNYRPMYFGNGGLTAGGTIKVSHSATGGATTVTSFSDNGGSVTLRSNSYWTVTTGNSIGTGTHSLRTEGTGFGTVAALTDLRLVLASAAAPGSDATPGGTTTNPQVNRTGLTTANLTNSFYWGSVNAAQTTLPIKLESFTGKPGLNGVQLDWRTSSEENCNFFELERSGDGEAFSPITRVNGHGTTSEAQHYTFVDGDANGRNYYRLKNVDFDGRFEYSHVIMVDAGGVSLFPNPVKDRAFSINLSSSDDSHIVFMDITGKPLFEQNFNSSSLHVALPESVNSGIYLIRLHQGTEQRTMRVFVAK